MRRRLRGRICKPTSDPAAFSLFRPIGEQTTDFSAGGLQRVSYARPGKLFTAHATLFQRTAGTLAPVRHQQVVDAIIGMLQKYA